MTARTETPNLAECRRTYREALLQDVVPFWAEHSPDRAHGGYRTFLTRDGSPYGTDKPTRLQAAGIWLFSRLYRTVEPRDDWLELARLGFAFLTRHGFDRDGRLFCLLSEDGRPLRRDSHVFVELAAAQAFSEYSLAAGDPAALERARGLFGLALDLLAEPGRVPPELIPQTRLVRSLKVPLALLATCRQLREHGEDEAVEEVAGRALVELLNDFVNLREEAVLEAVGMAGEMVDSPAGRLVCPGRAARAASLLMEEGADRDDKALIYSAARVLDMSLETGWDEEHGGLLHYVDVEGLPPERPDHDMKLWWAHAEALYAALLAYRLTRDKPHLDWFARVHDWAFSHFPDAECGEWFGYLHCDGTPALTSKGGPCKGACRLPARLLGCWKLLEELEAAGD